MTKKQRPTRTTRYMTSGGASDGIAYVRSGTFSDPTFLPRLSWSGDLHKSDYDRAALCAGIAGAENVAFFCDTSIFDDNAPTALWPALFDGVADAYITPRIEGELKRWLDRRSGHPVGMALRDPVKLNIASAADWTKVEQQSLLHYLNVLALRKRMMRWGELSFIRQTGRPPTEKEQANVRGLVQRALGERGYLLAKKGEMEKAAGGYSYADEELVYTAVAYALRTGRQSIILTKDEDLIEQFHRFLYLLDTHYRSMLIARAYRNNLASFRTRAMPRTGIWADAFVGETNIIVEFDDDLPWRVLSPEFNFVAVSCWLVGEGYQRLTFGAEREMQELLEVKGRTRGRNTDLLGARNCHLSLYGMPPPRPDMPPCFGIAEDRTYDIAGQKIPHLELIHGVAIAERFKDIVESALEVPGYMYLGLGS